MTAALDWILTILLGTGGALVGDRVMCKIKELMGK